MDAWRCGHAGERLIREIGMGHKLLGELKRTRRFKQVVALLAGGANVSEVAAHIIGLAERHLNLVANDRGMVEIVSLLMRLPMAASSPNCIEALHEIGVKVSNKPSTEELLGGIMEAVDSKVPKNKRTDMGELAQLALIESVSSYVRSELGLHADHERFEDLKGILKAARKPHHFGKLAKVFVGSFVARVLDYFVGPVLDAVTFVGGRFPTLAAASTFREALRTHGLEAARYVEKFSAGWYARTVESDYELTSKEVNDYAFGAMQKINSELRKGL